VHFIKQGHTALQTLGEKVVKGSGQIVSFGGGLLTEVVNIGFDTSPQIVQGFQDGWVSCD